MSVNHYLKCLVNVSYSYSSINFTTQVKSKIIDEQHISLNDILDNLSKQISLDKFSISYCEYDNKSNLFTNVGIYPLTKTILIGYNNDANNNIIYNNNINNNINNNNKITFIRIRLRQIISKENILSMELKEEDIEKLDESQTKTYFNSKSKRAKERKIGYIIKKILMWKTLYNGYLEKDKNENYKKIKFTLEQAAEKIGISKKSLDDYLIQLRIGRMFGFNFTEHKNDKVGILRAFVKCHKKEYEDKKNFIANNDIKNIVNVNINDIYNNNNFYKLE